MENIEAKVLLKNLLKRYLPEASIKVTEDEKEAIGHAISVLSENTSPTSPASQALGHPPNDTAQSEILEDSEALEKDSEGDIDIVIDCLDWGKFATNKRLCFDFGTAMSKVTLVNDETEQGEPEQITVLNLGKFGEQEEIDEYLLVSSVYIDSEGLIWFGQMAVERSAAEGADGSRQRLDNVKRYLSESGLNTKVGPQFNPTNEEITYGDMISAYLMFLTWTVNKCLESKTLDRNLTRRFALPSFDETKARDTAQKLAIMLGEAQILSDTFYSEQLKGIPLKKFLCALIAVRSSIRKYGFIGEDLSEPLGVAGSLISWKAKVNSLSLVVDVGAGTCDFSLYRFHYNPETKRSIGAEIAGTTRTLTEAGNHLDMLLKALILRKAGIDSGHPQQVNIHGAIELELRSYKETLFLFGETNVVLQSYGIHELVTIEEFLELPQVEKFSQSLQKTVVDILEGVDSSILKSAPFGTLALVLTGGGSSMPMVKDLAKGDIVIGGTNLNRIEVMPFPKWLEEDYPQFEEIYSRIAVSLGGSRKSLIQRAGPMYITAGDVKSTAQLGGYYTKGL